MKVLGIDNGLNGGLVMVNENKIIEAEVMPVIKVGKKREYDILKIVEYLKYWKPDFVMLEKAQPFPKQGGVSNFTTGHGYGLIKGLIVGLSFNYSIVSPKTWQKVMFEGMDKTNTKQMSYVICSQLWNGFDWRATPRCKKPHDGLTDAAMIAEYGRRRYNF